VLVLIYWPWRPLQSLALLFVQ